MKKSEIEAYNKVTAGLTGCSDMIHSCLELDEVCPYINKMDDGTCSTALKADALALLRRMKAKIDELENRADKRKEGRTAELIEWLRNYAEVHRNRVRTNCNEVADLLESLDERVDILSADLNDDYKEFTGLIEEE